MKYWPLFYSRGTKGIPLFREQNQKKIPNEQDDAPLVSGCAPPDCIGGLSGARHSSYSND